MAEIQEDIPSLLCDGFGTWDASIHFAQRDGNGAIVSLLSCGRPLCDGGQAVKSSKGYGVELDAREQAEKDPQFFGLQDRDKQRRGRIAKERRGSDAMVRTTGLNRRSPLPQVCHAQL